MANQFDGRVVLAQEAKISSASTELVVSVGTLQYTLVPPSNCLTIFLSAHPNNSSIVYVGEGFVSTGTWFTTLQAGEKISFNVNPDDMPSIGLISDTANQNIGILYGV